MIAVVCRDQVQDQIARVARKLQLFGLQKGSELVAVAFQQPRIATADGLCIGTTVPWRVHRGLPAICRFPVVVQAGGRDQRIGFVGPLEDGEAAGRRTCSVQPSLERADVPPVGIAGGFETFVIFTAIDFLDKITDQRARTVSRRISHASPTIVRVRCGCCAVEPVVQHAVK